MNNLSIFHKIYRKPVGGSFLRQIASRVTPNGTLHRVRPCCTLVIKKELAFPVEKKRVRVCWVRSNDMDRPRQFHYKTGQHEISARIGTTGLSQGVLSQRPRFPFYHASTVLGLLGPAAEIFVGFGFLGSWATDLRAWAPTAASLSLPAPILVPYVNLHHPKINEILSQKILF